MIKNLAVIAVAALGLASCSGSDSSQSDSGGAEAIEVVATTPQLVDFVRQVGGDDVALQEILVPGVDPHDYEPTAADIETLSSADVIIRNGVGLEEWFDATVEAASPQGVVVDASQSVALRTPSDDESEDEEGHDHADDHGSEDPHIWQSPLNAKIMVQNVSDALVAAAPEAAGDIQARTTDYLAELDQLDAEIGSMISALPNKQMVTNHDAFGYFIDQYGLDYVGAVVPSFDSQAELSSAQINELVAEIRATNAPAIFVESSISPRSADTIAREAGVRVVSGEDALYGDSLGDDGSYIEAMRHNARVITENLS